MLGALIGRGATSEVYAGEHRDLGHAVAIKLASAEDADAFVAEAARTRAIDHPNVVRVIDSGRDEASGRCYLVMERVDGENLAARLERAGRLDEDGARRLGAAIADGMQAAHDRGIVHRDLKPANVMLHGDQPKIVDFGIAKHLGDRSAVQTGRRIGTPAYMAPEQLTGGLIAPCVDVWALGVILFEATAARLPFEGYDDGRCPQLFEAAPRLSTVAAVSTSFDALVARCLQREPGMRPASMAEVARTLRGEVDDERITQDAGALPPAPPSRRRPWPVLAGVGAGAVAAVLLVATLLGGSDPETVRAAPAPATVPVPVPVPTAAPVDAGVTVVEPVPPPTQPPQKRRPPRPKPPRSKRETLD